MQISVVPPDHVDAVWPQVKEYLEGAAKYTYGRYEVEDIRDNLHGYDWLLWIAFDDEGVKGTVVTHFIEYPRARYLACPFVAGKDLDTWKAPMLNTLKRWARDNHCNGLESSARIGWEKALKDHGYKAIWQTFQMPAIPLDEE
jgi:hypothetical protein